MYYLDVSTEFTIILETLWKINLFTSDDKQTQLYAQSIFAYYKIVVVFNKVPYLLNGPWKKYKDDPNN